MPEEVYVDVRYKSIEIGSRLAVTSVSKASAYVQSPQPMPVGTSLVLLAGETLEIPVRVAGVKEQVAGLETPPGMTVTPDDLAGPALLWWTSQVQSDDEAPDTDVVDVVTPEEVEAAKAEIAAKENSAEPEASETKAAVDATAEPPAAEAASKPAKGKKRKRRRRQTKNR